MDATLLDTDTLNEVLKQKNANAIRHAADYLKGIRDPEAGRMAREDMDRMREETRRRIGTVEVAVDLVRDAHDP